MNTWINVSEQLPPEDALLAFADAAGTIAFGTVSVFDGQRTYAVNGQGLRSIAKWCALTPSLDAPAQSAPRDEWSDVIDAMRKYADGLPERYPGITGTELIQSELTTLLNGEDLDKDEEADAP